MSFGSGGGGFSFGSNNTNNNQSGSGFGGGFGSNTANNTGGFGSNTSNTGGFGSSTAASNPFGGSTFGSNTNSGGGFGSNTSASGSLFGSKPASNPFGSTASNTGGGGLFGSSTTNSGGFGSGGGGGFGSSTTTNNAFGGGNSGGSGFSFGGAAKPAFGSTTTSAPLFGQGGAGTTGGFGSSSSPFGAAGSGTALSSQPVPPSEGTAVTPYAPTLEKEAAGVSSNYQSINFMPPYQRYSFEELRLADYNAGRQFGNSTGQAGGFGSNSFGGFNSSNNAGFGGNTASNPFGSTTTASSGFGGNTSTSGFGGGGLFGNKPAGAGLFGGQSSAAPSGGLFGTSNNTTNNAFGGASTTGFGTNPAGGGLFGGGNSQTQPKPSLFSTNTSNTGSSFSFGGNANASNAPTGGGLFGGNTTNSNPGPFGGAQQPSGGLFSNNNNTNNQQKPSLFGPSTSGFGPSTNQTQPSGGLFSNAGANTGGGLFGGGNTTNANTSGGLFANNNQNSTGGGLFGNNANNQQKPGGLFGGSSFGNNNASTTGGGLFGGGNNQPSGGLFANNSNNTGSGFSFGNNANKPAAGSLFGTSGNQQQGGFGGSSLFAPNQSNQQNQQQSDFKVSSLNDPNPYGQTSIWTGLPVPTPDNSKPLFTPLSATQKLKESQSKPPPSLRLNQSRYMTPPRRSGFGFSYSTYGTPNSAASTPGGNGLSGSMYGSRSFNGGSFGRSFGKSASVSNLRSQFNSDGNGILSPDAFAATNTRWSSGNMRRLTIDRSIRNDLFSRPPLPTLPSNGPEKSTNGNHIPAPAANESSAPEPAYKLKKRVSFDQDTAGGQHGSSSSQAGALVRVEDREDDNDRSTISNGSSTPDAEPVRGNELAVVPEDRESADVSSRKTAVHARSDPQPGDYWMKPSRAELGKIPRDKLSRFVGFEVGRKGCGKVVFNGPVDLSSISLDDLYEKIVQVRLRSITVYPEASSKPPAGKGLNVPSTIFIENSWPRARGQPSSDTSGPLFEKHVNRLKKMNGTEFVSYEVTTGVWTFRVPHYTRYGLDYDDDDDDMDQSQLSAPPDSLAHSGSRDESGMEVDSEEHDDFEDDEDDTFAFKQKTLPGGYGRRSAIDYDNDVTKAQELEDLQDSEMEENSEDEDANQVSMVGSYPPPTPFKPILKASTMGTPGKALINIDGDWAEQLQRTISPRKQNRDALREVQSRVLLDRAYEPMKPKSNSSKNANKKDFRTSIDIMHSLFNRHEERMADLKGKKGKSQAGSDFEIPYAKRAKTFDDQAQADGIELSEDDKIWHASFKPHFTSTNKVIHKSNAYPDASGWTTEVLAHSETTGTDIVVTSLEAVNVENVTMDVKSLLTNCEVSLTDDVPFIKHDAVPFSKVKEQVVQHGGAEELDVYELLHVLFDDFEDDFTLGLSRQQQQEYQLRIRKDRLSKYLAELVWRRHSEHIKAASKVNGATAAVLRLTAKDVHAACDALMQEKNFQLSLLIAQIEQADDAFQDDIVTQISDWRGQNVLSEMSEEIRALYEILAGNTSIAQGKQNVPVEDRASTFAISEKIELDWVQAFSLCLWYGKHKNGDIAEIVAEFQEKLDSNVESATPIHSNGNEDPLWVVLKLFASDSGIRGKGSRTSAGAAKVDKPVLPQALSAMSQSFDSRASFRLHHVLSATLPSVAVDQEKADDLALALAFENSARGNVTGAVYALLHLSDSAKRAAQIKNLLDRHAASMPAPAPSYLPPLWTALRALFQIPAAWIYQAKALYARSSNESLAELHYLVLAKDYAQAHACLLRRVAPQLVIDEDWETLRHVVAKFGENPAQEVDSAVAAIGDEGIGLEWGNGGGVYADFVELMAMVDPSSSNRRDTGQAVNEKQKQKTALLERLMAALTAMNAQFKAETSALGLLELNKDREKLEERAALFEMGNCVARVVDLENADGGGDKKSILELPLTADARLVHARALGVEYYRGVMAR